MRVVAARESILNLYRHHSVELNECLGGLGRQRKLMSENKDVHGNQQQGHHRHTAPRGHVLERDHQQTVTERARISSGKIH